MVKIIIIIGIILILIHTRRISSNNSNSKNDDETNGESSVPVFGLRVTIRNDGAWETFGHPNETIVQSTSRAVAVVETATEC